MEKITETITVDSENPRIIEKKTVIEKTETVTGNSKFGLREANYDATNTDPGTAGFNGTDAGTLISELGSCL